MHALPFPRLPASACHINLLRAHDLLGPGLPHTQALEQALDNGVLELRDQGAGSSGGSEAEGRVTIIHQHPNFRLFAAQNPATGAWLTSCTSSKLV